MYGRLMNETLGKIHFWFSAAGVTLVFCGQLLAGYAGQQRRLYDPYQYTFLAHLQELNQYTSFFAFALGFGQLFFIVAIFHALFAGKKVKENPWEIGTIDWTDTTCPPIYHNFDKVPVVFRGPHEYNHPEVLEKLGRDWIGQTERLPDEKTEELDEAAAVPAE
jgi:cytochrome c oxidase subunit 1